MFLSSSFRYFKDTFNYSHFHLFHIEEDKEIDKHLQILIKYKEIKLELEKIGLYHNAQKQYFLIYNIY